MNRKFDVSKLKGRLSVIRDWLTEHHLPKRLVFILMGTIATIWFLIRVVPKPSRATYPCMRVAAPLMSSFVIYLLTFGGIAALLQKFKHSFKHARYTAAVSFLAGAMILLTFFMTQNFLNTFANPIVATGPDDGPNQPMGNGQGNNPGRVVWVWNPDATNGDCVNIFDLYKPENTNQGVVNKMFVDGILNLTGEKDLRQSWDAIFRNFNAKKNKDTGYTPGEKIFIKINQGTANGRLWGVERDGDFSIPKRYTNSFKAMQGYYGTCETIPNVILELLRELVYVVGVEQKDIAIGDPIAHIYDYNYDTWFTEFPDLVYVDKLTGDYGRTKINPTKEELVHYSDKSQSDNLYDIVKDADYLINVANLKPHARAGISLTAKNHFGSHGRRTAAHLHYSLVSPVSIGNPTNGGYGKYRVMVDMMGSQYLGRNTLLYVVDGLYGGGAVETQVPVKYYMPPFNNDWSSSIFLSQDQVALESVCYDFIRTEWNGTYTHNPANNRFENIPNINGVDDYLHQAADRSNWPDDIVYDPDNSGTPLPSLGVHEHWNDAARKQYSRNLGKSKGIELIAVPDTLVGRKGPLVTTSETWLPDAEGMEKSQKVTVASSGNKQEAHVNDDETEQHMVHSVLESKINEGVEAKKFYAVTIDSDNRKWFLTDVGIVSYDGQNWTLHNKNRRVPATDLKDLAFDYSDFGPELWLATPLGATVAELPVDAKTSATTYYADNSPIISENVVSVTVSRKGSLRWFGTDKGVSAFYNDKWLTPNYQRKYPELLFKDFPITAMATNRRGDSVYVATKGAGVARLYRNDVDAITSASEYAQWGPIELPSDTVNCIWITRDGVQWFGTNAGAARHTGNVTMRNWSVFNVDNGLIDNMVNAIAVDYMGLTWIGTPKGVNFYDNVKMRYLTKDNVLTSNNVLCITVDRDGAVWIGTDNGVTSYEMGMFTKYTCD